MKADGNSGIARGWSSLLHRRWAGLVDEASFAWISWLQARHRPEPDFRKRLGNYVDSWRGATLPEYYGLPPGYSASLECFPRGNGLRVRFPSPLPGPERQNRTAVFDLWLGPEGWSGPTMVMAHGLMSVSDFGYRYWAGRLNALGWNAAFMHLPYHYARRPLRLFPGELCVTADLVRTAETLRQGVLDLRVFVRWLRTQGATLMGGWGMSYGGWVLAEAACVEPIFNRLMLLEPIFRIEHAMWESPSGRGIRKTLEDLGISPETAAPHLRLVCPSLSRPYLKPQEVLLLGGIYDQVVPLRLLEEFRAAWQGCHLYPFPQGHVGYRLMRESLAIAQEIWPGDFDVSRH
ncbi:MAG: alpha/beta hydrolase [Methylacidiphilaceae bacterium]|nr:alpha/beta hydrolase [Candidatus Methylacidiphilaceae bacterium]